ncbi:MAG: outer membrane lipoprotein-sorting protein [Magnetococcales bacterium]|nr:outer membrane lipoprotein-sorting protein [Magnetococcales bacterium]
MRVGKFDSRMARDGEACVSAWPGRGKWRSGRVPPMWLGGMVAACLWFLALPLWAMDAMEILKSVDRTMHAVSCESFNRVTYELPNGNQRFVTLYTARASGRRALMVVVSPEELRGRAVLKVGDEAWLHMPGELETRKTTLLQSVVGGVFNNADFLLGDFSEEYRPTLDSEDEEHWKLTLKPLYPSTPHASVRLTVDKKSRLPVSLTQYDAAGAALKTIQFSESRDLDGAHRAPMLLETASGLNQAYRSSWRVGRIDEREFPDNVFTREFLPGAGRLMK